MHPIEPITLFLRLKLSNPVTPWVVLGLVAAGWLVAYLFVSSGSRS